jgi:putative Mn2+ efflux pump MntP
LTTGSVARIEDAQRRRNIMATLLLTAGLLLGLDSFAVSLAVGTLPLSPRRRRGLALSFALCDGLASWLGSTQGSGLHSLLDDTGRLGLAAVAAYGLYVLALARAARQAPPAGAGGGYWMVLGLPVCLSLDNLVAAGPDLPGVPAALTAAVLGALSGCLALLGLSAGAALARRLPARAGWLGGGLLLLVAATLACVQVLV